MVRLRHNHTRMHARAHIIQVNVGIGASLNLFKLEYDLLKCVKTGEL